MATGQGTGYLTIIENEYGDVTGLRFLGDASWLEEQKDSRSQWHTLPQLSKLILEQHQITVWEMAYIANLRGITDIELGVFPDAIELDPEIIPHIQRLKKIESLSIYGKGFRKDDWSFLSSFPRLKYLNVGGELELDDAFLKSASKSPLLEVLKVAKGQFSREGIRALQSLSSLHHLALSTSLTAEEIASSLTRLKKLQVLEVSSPGMTEEVIELLKSIQGLYRLRVNGMWVVLAEGNAEMEEFPLHESRFRCPYRCRLRATRKHPAITHSR